ncbi:MAG TPA: Holliday junction branch migration protein RuvA [Syntrophales bacterium]|nr:Holliday junction branch migration protein RuvA [Syntrophales bacterium]HOL59545.1 Holliday junction branch migration protein RuvA [Syntrophales bacterium]HPO35635.1 Holliday junction branch migration protein RuvA [Syntrophales bacterium]
MIARLRGTIVHKSLPQCIIDTNGVGYEVKVPLSTYYELPDLGASVTLLIHTHVKDDAIDLYGFWTELEREIFRHLISISGIGPKQAVNILSGINPSTLLSAIREGDVNKLTSIPGIGKKMAGRMILELKDKLRELSLPFTDKGQTPSLERETIKRDVLSALINLGYKTNLAKAAIEHTFTSLTLPHPSLDQVLKETLRYLSGGSNLGR